MTNEPFFVPVKTLILVTDYVEVYTATWEDAVTLVTTELLSDTSDTIVRLAGAHNMSVVALKGFHQPYVGDEPANRCTCGYDHHPTPAAVIDPTL